MLTRIRCSGGVGLTILHGSSHGMCCVYSGFSSIQIGFFLKLANVLLVTNPLVAKPVRYLKEEKSKKRGLGEKRKMYKMSRCTRHCTTHSVIASSCFVWVHQVDGPQPPAVISIWLTN